MANPNLLVYKSSAGTGKTFTLAAYYISLLMRGESHRSLLAVTFTNKATAEMKERILTHLYLLSKCPSDAGVRADEAPFLTLVKGFMKKADFRQPDGNAVTDDYVYRKAAELFPVLIEDYDGMTITTIDSFLQQLLQGLAHAINTAAGYRVDLDTAHAAQLAIDQIMQSHIGEQEGLMAAIVDYVRDRLDSEQNWDVRGQMRELSDELFKESLQTHIGDMHTDKTSVETLRKAIKAWRSEPEYLRAEDICKKLQEHHDAIEQMKNSKTLNTFVKKLVDSFNGKAKNEDMFKQLSDTGQKQIANAPTNSEEEFCYPLFAELNALCAVLRPQYLREKYTLAHLHDMVMLTYIREQISRNQAEENSLLLADTADLLSRALGPGDADFILECAGLRFKHVMLDEFQDTSRLQWQNFKPLLEEVLSADGSVFIVGDIKQSIYRWRNGDWHTMDRLAQGTELGTPVMGELSVNRRSLQEVIRFNLQTMRLLTQNPDKEASEESAANAAGVPSTALYDEGFDGSNIDSYSDSGKLGGYVRMLAYPHSSKKNEKHPAKQDQKEALLKQMFSTIEALLAHGASASDCLILCRTKKEAADVIKAFSEAQADSGQLAKVALASADSFLLESSASVCIVIAALRYVLNRDKVALRYAELATGRALEEPLKGVSPYLPLLDLMEKIIDICLCDNGECLADDLVYIHSLKDKTRSYISSYGSDPKAFLRYFDDKMHEEAVPATMQNSIRLMTAHKSKGLEGRFVFIPFCQWDLVSSKGKLWSLPATDAPDVDNYVAIENCKTLAETCTPEELESGSPLSRYATAYGTESEEERVDAVNLLYVAITRAREALYISMLQEVPEEKSKRHKLEDVGSLLLNSRDKLEEMYVAYDGWSVGDCFVSWESDSKNDPTLGSIAPAGKKADDSPFATPELPDNMIPATYHSEHRDILFVQSQESLAYSVSGDDSKLAQARFGTICHDILAEMTTANDQAEAIRRFRLRGIIETDEEEKRISEAISKAWDNPSMCSWFDGTWQLMREEAILVAEEVEKVIDGEKKLVSEVHEYRPDRVMLCGNDEAFILDYKFGEEHPKKYSAQLRGYMKLLQGLGRTRVSAYLWYAQTGELKEVKL